VRSLCILPLTIPGPAGCDTLKPIHFFSDSLCQTGATPSLREDAPGVGFDFKVWLVILESDGLDAIENVRLRGPERTEILRVNRNMKMDSHDTSGLTIFPVCEGEWQVLVKLRLTLGILSNDRLMQIPLFMKLGQVGEDVMSLFWRQGVEIGRGDGGGDLNFADGNLRSVIGLQNLRLRFHHNGGMADVVTDLQITLDG
jgi:hypothetical protein